MENETTKFMKKVNEITKKAIDLTPPKMENEFRKCEKCDKEAIGITTIARFCCEHSYKGKEEFNLSEKFTKERINVNRLDTEEIIAHCHVTINKLENNVKEFIRRLKERLREPRDGWIALSWANEEIDKLAGDKLT